MPQQTVAVALNKGGTGKTTVATNTAATAHAHGRSTLLIDLDPNGAATEAVGLEERHADPEPNLHTLLVDKDGTLDELIVETEWMDVVPANIDMTATEDLLTTKMRPRQRLRDALDGLDGYDLVIIDCPGNLGNLTDNALVASEHVLIPALAESPSIAPVDLLFEQLEIVAEEFNTLTEAVGIIGNRVEDTNQAERVLERFADFGVPVWEIRKRVALQEAYEAGVPLSEYEPENDMNDVFEAIAKHLETVAGREVVAG